MEIINTMSLEEAQKWELSVAHSVNGLRSILADGYERQVWLALGYLDWTECLQALSDKYGFSERHAWRLHNANQTQKLLTHGSVDIPERQLRPLTQLEPEQRREAWELSIERGNGKPTGTIVEDVVSEFTVKVCDVNPRHTWVSDIDECPYCTKTPEERIEWLRERERSKPHVSHNSGINEWYTPPEYIAAAVAVMGRIDIDPASSEKANEIVGASKYYTMKDDGLSQIWAGKVWMNPPYSLELIRQFVEKYSEYVTDGYISEGIVLVNNATETNWFSELVNVSDAIVFTKGRVRFLDPQGNPGAPLQGQAIIYSGKNPDRFFSEFLQFGWGARL